MAYLKFGHISATLTLLLSINFLSKAQVSTDLAASIATLPCTTWDKANWKKFDKHLSARGIHPTGARLREYDDNIQLVVVGRRFAVFQDTVYVRWILKDTTIHYDIKISKPFDEVIVKTTSNQCGLRLPLHFFAEYSDDIFVVVERNKDYNKGSFNWGTRVAVTPLALEERQTLKELLPNDRRYLTDIKSRTALVKQFLENNLPLDALTILERWVEKNGQDKATMEEYWKIVNDIRITGF